MKRLIGLCIALVLMASCKTANPVTKLDKSSQVGIKGNWTITSVTYPGSQYIKVNSFGIADSQCFVGSTWNFISNNNKGSMALAQNGCSGFSSPIIWSVNREGSFVLKILDPGVKAKTVTSGYVLKIANQTETSFQLIDKMDVGGNFTDVVYSFQKAM